MIKFLERLLTGKKRPDPTAPIDPRELYYRQVQGQAKMAKDMAEFIRVARNRGFPIQVWVEVDGQFCGTGPIHTHREKGAALIEFLENYLHGIRFMYLADLEHMDKQKREAEGLPDPLPPKNNVKATLVPLSRSRSIYEAVDEYLQAGARIAPQAP